MPANLEFEFSYRRLPRISVLARSPEGAAYYFGNLIGCDVLEYLDLALTHSTRVGYLGRTETLA